MILGIDWTVDSQLIDGYSTPNLYGLLFVTGMIIGYFVIRKMFRSEHVPEMLLDKLLIFMVIGTVVGARLGHVLFYGPWWDGVDEYGNPVTGYFSHPETIFKVWEGGLASHGAAIVLLLVLYYFSKKIAKRPMLWILDRVAAPIAIAGCFIRLGNLVNHEIVGIPTDLPWGFNFTLSDEHAGVYRHPSQLYEAICYLLTFVVIMRMYWKSAAKAIPGRIFGMWLILIWTARFLIEFIKEGQNSNDAEWVLKTGQWLSIPFILLGIYLLVRKVSDKEMERFQEGAFKPEEKVIETSSKS